MMRSAVDLPQPEGPSRLRNSPWPTSSDMSESASVPFENLFEIARSEIERPRRLLPRVLAPAAGRAFGRRASARALASPHASSVTAPAASFAPPARSEDASAYFTSSLPTPLQTYSVV